MARKPKTQEDRDRAIVVEVEALKKDIRRFHRNPDDIPFVACDNSCIVARPEGMATNGGCRCDERKLRQVVQWLWRKVRFLQETIRMMRGMYILCPHTYDADDKYCELPQGHPGPHGTIFDIGESHEVWRGRADERLRDVNLLLTGMTGVESIKTKFGVTTAQAKELWARYIKDE